MIVNAMISREGNVYYVDTQCSEEHLGQECDCSNIATTKSKLRAIIIANRKGRELNVPVMKG